MRLRRFVPVGIDYGTGEPAKVLPKLMRLIEWPDIGRDLRARFCEAPLQFEPLQFLRRNGRLCHASDYRAVSKADNVSALAQLVQIVAPPLRHFHAFFPVSAAMVGRSHLVAVTMG